MALFNWKVWELYCVDKSWKFLTSIAICVIMCFSFAHPLCNVTKKIGIDVLLIILIERWGNVIP